MKYPHLLILSCLTFLFTGCGEELIRRPENLIPQEQMTNILYDVALMNAIDDTYPETLEDNNIEVMELIYEKYEIDSSQYVLSDRYYASRPHLYEEIYQELHDRLKDQRDSISLILSPNKAKDSIPANKP